MPPWLRACRAGHCFKYQQVVELLLTLPSSSNLYIEQLLFKELSTLNQCAICLLGDAAFSRICSLKFIGPKVWSSIPDDIKLSTTFTFKWKLKKHLLHETNSQLWTLAIFHLSNKLLWFLVFCNSVLLYVCIYFFVFSVCTFYAFRHEVHLLFFFYFTLFSFVPH